jgi:hypothetical protein
MITDNNVEYSFASSTDARAGNRYEEQVWAFPGTNPCFAIRYFIHYMAIENYPKNTVSEFNRDALIDQFDKIRTLLFIFNHFLVKKVLKIKNIILLTMMENFLNYFKLREIIENDKN